MAISRLFDPLRKFASTLFHERLSPGRAAAAVFLGIFIAHVPIYGFQAVAAVGLAVMFGLNKPLTLAATFINNPLFQPVLIALSVQLGQLIVTGKASAFAWPDMSAEGLKKGLTFFLVGTMPLGIILGSIGALATFVVLRLRNAGDPRRRDRVRFVNQLFAKCRWSDRGFVRWKLRLDRIFDILATQDLGSGIAVDLGCGHGIALGMAAYELRDRPLVGCDLNPKRIAAGRLALGVNADLRVEDVRRLELPRAGLILILDVLQYLGAEEQLALLARCCSALEPGGIFLFRVHDRKRGLLSKLSLAFDRVIFFVGRAGVEPLMLSAVEYRNALENAGMRFEEHLVRNRLPLAHLVFVAKKPVVEVNAWPHA